MMPQMTMLASAFAIALMGSTILPQPVGPDNSGLPNSTTDDRSTAEIYAAYFPSPQVDATDGIAVRIQRNLSTDPVFSTVAGPESPLQRKLANAPKANPRPQAHRGVSGKTRIAGPAPTSSARTNVTRRRGGRQTIVELARTRLGHLSRNRFKDLARRKREQLRRQELRRAKNHPQPRRVLRRSNVRERLRLNASPQHRGSSPQSSNSG